MFELCSADASIPSKLQRGTWSVCWIAGLPCLPLWEPWKRIRCVGVAATFSCQRRTCYMHSWGCRK